MVSETVKNLIPYYGDYKVRKQIDQIFSRQMLGAVLLGKFVGDYAAILATRYLGTDLGYGVGALFIFVFFVYWEKISARAKESAEKAKEKAEEAKEKAEEATNENDNN